jgi:ABC-type nickel/cobalt efflux system permease component RcnA
MRIIGIIAVVLIGFWIVNEVINEQVEQRIQQKRPAVAQKAKGHKPHSHKVRARKQDAPTNTPAPASAAAMVDPQSLPVIEGTPVETAPVTVAYQQPQVVRQEVVVMRGGPFGNDFVDPYPYIPRPFNWGHRMGFVGHGDRHHDGNHHRGGDHDGYRRHH